MSKKLLAILGGPHKNGATGTMLQYAVDVATKRGWEVEVVNLYEKNIAFCKGCNICLQTANCVVEDDIVEITRQMRACDMVVLASPVYWANVPAAVKNLFDRFRGAAMAETKTFPKPRFSKNQRYLLLTACNTPAPFSFLIGQSVGAKKAMKEFFKTGGMKYAGCCVWTGMNKKEMPSRIKRKIEKAFS
ncbi:MAG: flavodoxin family protein [bacterium]|nr:flavodoxin family protein [bacterium]